MNREKHNTMKRTKNIIAGLTVLCGIALAFFAMLPESHAVTYNPSQYANPPGKFLNVAPGTATTTVKSGAGVLYSVTINTKGLTNTLTCYDNTAASGTKIAIISTIDGSETLTYNLAFATGLTCISAGGTGADYTVSYR